jgi:hypothetical protein
MSGGAGYVLSRAALRRFATVDRHNVSFNCRQDSAGDEDIEMARCLFSYGVKMGFSADSAGLSRFTSGPLHLILNPYHKQDESNAGNHWNARCCSQRPISFHSIPGKVMNVLNYFIYQLKVNDNAKNIQRC